MKIHFSPNEQEIIDALRDRTWHCVYTEIKMKDDRARITSIRRKLLQEGYDVKSQPCNLHNHESRIVMRKIVQLAPKSTTLKEILRTNPERLKLFEMA